MPAISIIIIFWTGFDKFYRPVDEIFRWGRRTPDATGCHFWGRQRVGTAKDLGRKFFSRDPTADR